MEANGDVVMLQNVGFSNPAAVINVVQKEFEVNVKLQGPLRLDPKGYEMPLEIRLYQRGPANSDADILNDAPVAVYHCEKMIRGTGADTMPRGVCTVDVDQIGTFDVAIKSDRTLLSVKRSVDVPSSSPEAPGAIDFIGPAHDPDDQKGLHEGNLNEDVEVSINSVAGFDFAIWSGTFGGEQNTCDVEPDLVTSIDNFSIGDFDKNSRVNVLDFSIFLSNYLESSPQEE